MRATTQFTAGTTVKLSAAQAELLNYFSEKNQPLALMDVLNHQVMASIGVQGESTMHKEYLYFLQLLINLEVESIQH